MKSERFELRLDPQTLTRIDEWRAGQADLPSRAEAIRRLVDSGLARPEQRNVSLRDGDKLSLMMLRDLYTTLDVKGEIDPDFVAKAVEGGHHWGLEWKYPGIFDIVPNVGEVVAEVVDVLEMWHIIESGYDNLTDGEKKRVAEDAGPFGKDVAFAGFDGNHEIEHLSVAKFLVNELDRFDRFKGRDLNSHWTWLNRYRRMLKLFKPMIRTLRGGELSHTQIGQLLNADDGPSDAAQANP